MYVINFTTNKKNNSLTFKVFWIFNSKNLGFLDNFFAQFVVCFNAVYCYCISAEDAGDCPRQ